MFGVWSGVEVFLPDPFVASALQDRRGGTDL